MRHPNTQNGSDSDQRQIGMPVHLEDDRVAYAIGPKGRSLSFCDIACIRLSTFGSARLCLTLTAVDGRKIAMRWNARHPSASSFFTLAVDIMARVSRQNQFVTFAVGPSRRTWIAASIGLMTSISLIFGMTWVALTGRGLPTVALPMALAPFALVVVMPILINGPSRTVGLQQLLNALAEHQPAAIPSPSVQTRLLED